MNASPALLSLLDDIVAGRCGRKQLAQWLAERSLQYLESSNMIDRMIVADLDAALGEVQRGTHDEQFIVEAAHLLEFGLGLTLPGRPVTMEAIEIDLTGSGITFRTASSNALATAMSQYEVEVVRPAA